MIDGLQPLNQHGLSIRFTFSAMFSSLWGEMRRQLTFVSSKTANARFLERFCQVGDCNNLFVQSISKRIMLLSLTIIYHILLITITIYDPRCVSLTEPYCPRWLRLKSSETNIRSHCGTLGTHRHYWSGLGLGLGSHCDITSKVRVRVRVRDHEYSGC